MADVAELVEITTPPIEVGKQRIVDDLPEDQWITDTDVLLSILREMRLIRSYMEAMAEGLSKVPFGPKIHLPGKRG